MFDVKCGFLIWVLLVTCLRLVVYCDYDCFSLVCLVWR